MRFRTLVIFVLASLILVIVALIIGSYYSDTRESRLRAYEIKTKECGGLPAKPIIELNANQWQATEIEPEDPTYPAALQEYLTPHSNTAISCLKRASIF